MELKFVNIKPDAQTAESIMTALNYRPLMEDEGKPTKKNNLVKVFNFCTFAHFVNQQGTHCIILKTDDEGSDIILPASIADEIGIFASQISEGGTLVFMANDLVANTKPMGLVVKMRPMWEVNIPVSKTFFDYNDLTISTSRFNEVFHPINEVTEEK